MVVRLLAPAETTALQCHRRLAVTMPIGTDTPGPACSARQDLYEASCSHSVLTSSQVHKWRLSDLGGSAFPNA